jgi:regulator of replication initiation timing
MKTETLEMIIEELASALQTERWMSKSLREENSKLKDEVEKLQNDLSHSLAENALAMAKKGGRGDG